MNRTSVTDERFITTGSLKFSNLLPLLKRIVLEMISEFNILLKNNNFECDIMLINILSGKSLCYGFKRC